MTEQILPIYELKIDDLTSYVEAIALVEKPAIEIDFLAFNHQEQFRFAYDDEKMELLGAAMVPNQKIYRRNKNGDEFQVFFSENTIRQIAQSFFKRGFQSNMNIEHSEKNADSYVFQSMIVDKAKGISFMDLPDGSWVVGVKVLNPAVWQDIKAGKRKGFSVEGDFELIKQKFTVAKDEEDEIIEMLQQIQKLIEGNI